jgi:hypothetical protein
MLAQEAHVEQQHAKRQHVGAGEDTLKDTLKDTPKDNMDMD